MLSIIHTTIGFHITFNELSKERPDLCKTTHLGHVLELPSDEKGKNVFLTRYYQLYKKRKQGSGGGSSDDGNSGASTSSSNGANDAFNNMIKNLKNRGYKRKGNLLLLPFHQIKKCKFMSMNSHALTCLLLIMICKSAHQISSQSNVELHCYNI